MQVAAAALCTRYSIVKISEDVYFDLPKLFSVREKPCGRDAQVIINDSHFIDTMENNANNAISRGAESWEKD